MEGRQWRFERGDALGAWQALAITRMASRTCAPALDAPFHVTTQPLGPYEGPSRAPCTRWDTERLQGDHSPEFKNIQQHILSMESLYVPTVGRLSFVVKIELKSGDGLVVAIRLNDFYRAHALVGQ